jgi:hypothetical protein
MQALMKGMNSDRQQSSESLLSLINFFKQLSLRGFSEDQPRLTIILTFEWVYSVS